MIIDTLLFSEPHESDLLYLKFVLESNFVDLWMIQENHFTTQGEYKGIFAQKMLLEEERFKPFLSKVVLCSDNEQHGTENNENVNFMREKWQRAICLKGLRDIANDHDIIVVSDVDEAIDFSDKNRIERFFDIVNQNKSQPVSIGRMRYWYDYDNRCYIPGLMIPIIPYSILRQYPQLISHIRLCNNTNPKSTTPIISDGIKMYNAGEDPIAFEYSYVFRSIDDIWRKKTTFAHNNYVYDCLKVGLECNHFPSSPLRGDSKPGTHQHDWLEKVELTEQNSPKYVRDNLEKIRTNLVDPNYKENRAKRYGTV